MKNIQHKLLLLLFITMAFPDVGSSQDSIMNEPEYEVNRIYPYITITKEVLTKATSLIDLNMDYKPSWVRKYISVEILTREKGKIVKARSKNDTLSQEQKNIMDQTDAGSKISVKVRYLPENTLKNNDIKEINFSLHVDPESEATFLGGQQALKQYLKENAIDHIPDGSFRGYDLAAITFTINEEGEIINARVFDYLVQTSKIQKVEQVLLEAIRNMPPWEPAEYSNGMKVKQDFVLTVGNMQNCLIHLFRIRRD